MGDELLNAVRQMDRYDEGNSGFSKFCERV